MTNDSICLDDINDTNKNLVNEKRSIKVNFNLNTVGRNVKKQFRENILLVATLIAVIIGISLGFILRQFFEFNDNQIAYFGFVGQLFLRMLKFLILPLIATSLISGIAGLGSNSAGKIAARALVYYFSTTITAVIIGIILVLIIKPGVGKGSQVDDSMGLPIDTSKRVTTHDTLLDLVRNLFPDNIIEMAFTEYETTFTPRYKFNITFENGTSVVFKKLPTNSSSESLNIIFQ
jgi:solute carrier family 1 (high affinity glutamate transporter) protein 2